MAWNATLILTDGTTQKVKGKTVYNFQNYDINISSFNTSMQTQYDTSQVHRGMSWFPIRRSEQQVMFTIEWPLISAHVNSRPRGFENIAYQDGFARMNKLQNAIRIHHEAAVLGKGSNTPPMTLVYSNNSSANFNPMIGKQKNALVFQGWMSTSEKEYVRFKNTFTRNYSMNVLTKQLDTIATLTQHYLNTNTGQYSFAPIPKDLSTVGKNWTSTTLYRNTGIDISRIPGGR